MNYYIKLADGKEIGPFSLEEIRYSEIGKTLSSESKIRIENSGEWLEAGKIRGLEFLLGISSFQDLVNEKINLSDGNNLSVTIEPQLDEVKSNVDHKQNNDLRHVKKNQKKQSRKEPSVNLTKDNTNSVSPVHRWLARLIDIMFFTPFALFIIVPLILTFNILASEKVEPLSLPVFIFSSILFLFILISIDTLIGWFFGNTPGKALFRIRICELDGQSLKFSRRCNRNIGFMTFGSGGGIPFVESFFWLAQYIFVLTGRPTLYDKILGFAVVKSGQISFVRGLFCLITFFILVGIQAAAFWIANQALNPQGWFIGWRAVTDALNGAI